MSEGVESMYLTEENIDTLEEIILNLNNMENDEEKRKYLDEHVQNSSSLLKVLKKLNKSKFPKEVVKTHKKKKLNLDSDLYEEDEIYEILLQKDDESILEEYLLVDLQKMYMSIYKRKPSSSYDKRRILSTLRSRWHTMNRTMTFMKAAEEHKK